MPFDLQPFMEEISTNGVSPTSKFDVSISQPPLMQDNASNSSLGFINQMNTMLPLRASSCSTPGAAFLMHETNKWGVGPKIKMPYNVGFADIRMSILADSEGIVESYFTLWMNLCYNFSYSSESQATFLTSYRNDIASPVVNINKYDRFGALISTYVLSNCMPTMFVPAPLDWNATDDLAKFTLGLTYTSFDLQ
jgi:hypothetical protein